MNQGTVCNNPKWKLIRPVSKSRSPVFRIILHLGLCNIPLPSGHQDSVFLCSGDCVASHVGVFRGARFSEG